MPDELRHNFPLLMYIGRQREVSHRIRLRAMKRRPIAMLRPPVTQRIAIPLKEVGSSVLTSFPPQYLLQPQEEQLATAIDGFFCSHMDPTPLDHDRLRIKQQP